MALSTATSARSTRGTWRISSVPDHGPGPPAARVAAMAPVADPPGRLARLSLRRCIRDQSRPVTDPRCPPPAPRPAVRRRGTKVGRRFLGECLHGNGDRPRSGWVGESRQVDPAGADAVFHVMHGVGDIIGPVRHLSLDAGQPRTIRRWSESTRDSRVITIRTKLPAVSVAAMGA